MTGRGIKRFPHIHHCQAELLGLLFPEKLIKLVHARCRAILTTEPDRAMTDQIAHDNPVSMTLADRDLVDADGLRTRRASTLELSAHVLHVQRLDCVPVQTQLLGNIFDGSRTTASTHVIRKALGIERIVGQERQSLALHRTTLTTLHPTYLHVEQNAKRAARQIPHLPPRAVVETAMQGPASSAGCFFVRRDSVTIRVCGSPKQPRTVVLARKPGNAYASAKWRRLGILGIGKSCQIYPHLKQALNPMKIGIIA